MNSNPDCQNYPLVSVCLTTSSWGPWLGEAIDSVLHQTWHNWELLIVRDQSTATIENILAKYTARYADRIDVLDPQPHWGADISLPCLAHARGEFIATLATDDRMSPDRLAREMDYLRCHPDANAVRSIGDVYVDADNSLSADAFEFPSTIDLFGDALHNHCLIPGISLLTRKTAAQALLLTLNESEPAAVRKRA